MTDKLQKFLNRVNGDSFVALCQSVCDQLRQWDKRYDWVGIYWVDGAELELKAWSGRQATEHVRIPIQQGICGAAVREERTIIVDDVNQDPRYLSCFVNTHSEIVVPIHSADGIVGEIDIDGLEVGAYNADDQIFLEAVAQYIGEQWKGS